MTEHAAGTCRFCGGPLATHDRHVRYMLPDPVLAVPEAERRERTWQQPATGHPTLLQVQGLGAFVRALLPVHLDDGDSVTFGTWLGVHPDELQRLYRTWWTPEYRDLVVDGRLANAIQPWGEDLLGASVRASVRDPQAIPYVESSELPLLAHILHARWPPEQFANVGRGEGS